MGLQNNTVPPKSPHNRRIRHVVAGLVVRLVLAEQVPLCADAVLDAAVRDVWVRGDEPPVPGRVGVDDLAVGLHHAAGHAGAVAELGAQPRGDADALALVAAGADADAPALGQVRLVVGKGPRLRDDVYGGASVEVADGLELVVQGPRDDVRCHRAWSC